MTTRCRLQKSIRDDFVFGERALKTCMTVLYFYVLFYLNSTSCNTNTNTTRPSTRLFYQQPNRPL
jgi:hypothetical protein